MAVQNKKVTEFLMDSMLDFNKGVYVIDSRRLLSLYWVTDYSSMLIFN